MTGLLEDVGTVGGVRIGRVTVGAFAENCYLVAPVGGGDAIIIDPGAEADAILEAARGWGLTPRLVINTHGHMDHIGANAAVVDAFGAALLVHAEDAAMLPDPGGNLSAFLPPAVVSPAATRHVAHGEELVAGDVRLTVLHTPGHTRGSICLALGQGSGGALLSGDTLFAGSVGRVDLPGGSWTEIMCSIEDRLLGLPDDVRVLPGHGEATSIGRERGANPFVLEWRERSR